jgi:hypothetical protein
LSLPIENQDAAASVARWDANQHAGHQAHLEAAPTPGLARCSMRIATHSAASAAAPAAKKNQSMSLLPGIRSLLR